MEELDRLKQDWKKNTTSYPEFSEKEIYAMLHKKSSSILKWILIISILELAFWLVLSFAFKDNPSNQRIDSFEMDYITIPMSLLNYVIIIYFSCLFYINYRKITTTDNVKTLMATILKTRKTVSNYIYAIITYAIICTIVLFIMYLTKDAQMIKTMEQSEASGHLVSFYLLFLLIALITIGVMILFVWLFYKLVYGLLLKRLHRNYEELKKIDF